MYQVSSCPCCENCNPAKLNIILAAVSGTLFSIAWWLLIGLVSEFSIDGRFVLPGLFGTLALVAINIIPTGLIKQPNMFGGSDGICCGGLMIKIYLLLGFMVAFGSLIGATFILFYFYILDKNELQKWPGWAVFLENFFIFSATIILRCRISHDM